ncbi:hypothetical protein Poli38472_013196 [Pythium oligandrum]|uniref:FYVE-type domain-containing protein n=1 Tax=Pythium oligandrum TaxID=41045 RepID=A0A8K1F9K2_PYTOL|nr:hypothetical protein Poli38472_013196 [Pythium oligandrum]|eukprot:TMW55305.1 hypothetical protein Poli38472_013196 [Pythium oligandrum]
MKFPLADDPFTPVLLTDAMRREYAKLSATVLQNTIREHDLFLHADQGVVDGRQWKPLKAKEGFTVYKRLPRRDFSARASSSGGGLFKRSSSTTDDNMGFMGVGSVVGSFEDVMLGVTTRDVPDMKLRSSYLDDETVDWRVLSPLTSGTNDDPFLSHSLRWTVKSVSNTASVVRPRDIVFLDCTGLHTLPNGQQIGYFIMHSVELPQCPSLPGLIRCKLSWCYLFTPRNKNAVDVYLRSSIDFGGHVGEKLATVYVTKMLTMCRLLSVCGQNKKLAWMMTETSDVRRFQLGNLGGADFAAKSASSSRPDHCRLCAKSASFFRSFSTCELCLKQVCSRCITVRKLCCSRSNGDVLKIRTGFCKNCITRASAISSRDIAVAHLITGGATSPTTSALGHSPTKSRRRITVPCEAPKRRHSPFGVGAPAVMRTCTSSTASTSSHCFSDDEDSPPPEIIPLRLLEEETDDELREPMSSVDANSPMSVHELVTYSSPSKPVPFYSPPRNLRDAHQRQLWMQMAQLRLAMDHVYQITQQTASAMRRISP